MRDKRFVLACDIGGTHITAAIVDTDNWVILEDTITRQHVDSSSDAKSILQNWTDCMRHCIALSPQEVQQIGIAMPGPFDYEEGRALMIGQTKYDSLYKMLVTQPIKDNLAGLPIQKISYINDAAAFLQGEIFAQGLEHKDRVLGITLGTGLGSAVWTKGEKAFDAALWEAPFRESIFEEFLVTRWFTKRFEELTGIQEPGLKEILENHDALPSTKILLEEYVQHLLDFLAYFSEKHEAINFIIGGNITKAWEKICVGKKTALAAYNIELGKYQEHAAIIGAASLFNTPQSKTVIKAR
ncbi:ROK family protein [Sphingobacterium sp. lm-10]|uniref:ROK family protein n=1 Tax=Sphingobacterium sp. lm-10 TaxID=2944904 RepID=UPI002020F516|nr:ROK family protein [Sphingobacterium sp. lm-10]MCL7987778.1 ROK family protein [Sphingobacterium sp. lm-10]